jgi:hypothetical protein
MVVYLKCPVTTEELEQLALMPRLRLLYLDGQAPSSEQVLHVAKRVPEPFRGLEIITAKGLSRDIFSLVELSSQAAQRCFYVDLCLLDAQSVTLMRLARALEYRHALPITRGLHALKLHIPRARQLRTDDFMPLAELSPTLGVLEIDSNNAYESQSASMDQIDEDGFVRLVTQQWLLLHFCFIVRAPLLTVGALSRVGARCRYLKTLWVEGDFELGELPPSGEPLFLQLQHLTIGSILLTMDELGPEEPPGSATTAPPQADIDISWLEQADTVLFSEDELNSGHLADNDRGEATEMRLASKRAICQALQRLSIHAPVLESFKLTRGGAMDMAIIKLWSKLRHPSTEFPLRNFAWNAA